MSFDLHALLNLAVAVIGGLGVGIEREWSGHATGPHARFAGVRTFTLLGLASGLAGWLWVSGVQGLAMILLAGLGGLVVAAYFAASRRDVDGTTEVAAFVVMAAGVLAGAGSTRVAAGILAVTFLLLVEKKRLHALVSKLDRDEIRAAARFAVMATVILPLLPEGPYGPLGGIRPRVLWALVLFFSGLSFAGFVARRAFGRNRGYAIAGTLGGIVSSTSATFAMAQLSRKKPEVGRALASGALGANVVLFPRVLISSLVLAPPLAAALWPAFVRAGRDRRPADAARLARRRHGTGTARARAQPAAVRVGAPDDVDLSAGPVCRRVRERRTSAVRRSTAPRRSSASPRWTRSRSPWRG